MDVTERQKEAFHEATEVIKKYAPDVIHGGNLMMMSCTLTNSIFMAEQKALREAYETMSKHLAAYEAKVSALFRKQKPWPRKKHKKFHRFRVGGS